MYSNLSIYFKKSVWLIFVFLFLSEKVLASELTVYKTPTCGCCSKWLVHLKESKIDFTAVDLPDLGHLKQLLGIEPRYRSCHTAVSDDGQIFEGHVPAKFIKQYMALPANQKQMSMGLSVPAMPVGSPGMEYQGRFMPYKVLLLKKDGSSEVFKSVTRYEAQF